MRWMSTTRFEAAVQRATAKRHARLAEDLIRLREDAGLSRALLARQAGVDRRFLDRIEAGTERPTIETYQRLAIALGADFATRLYPTTGSTIRDRHQGRMLELTLSAIHPRWDRYTEASRGPARSRVDRPAAP